MEAWDGVVLVATEPKASCISGCRAPAEASRPSVPALQAKESVHPKHGAVEKLEHGIHSRLHHVERWLRSEIRIGSTLSKDGADGLDTRPSTIDDEVHLASYGCACRCTYMPRTSLCGCFMPTSEAQPHTNICSMVPGGTSVRWPSGLDIVGAEQSILQPCHSVWRFK